MEEIERQYDVRVTLDKDLSGVKYTGFFAEGTLEEALYSVCWPLKLTWKVDERRGRNQSELIKYLMQKNLILTLLVTMGYGLPMASQEMASRDDFTLEIELDDDLGSIIELLASRNQLHFAYAPSILNTKPQVTGIISGEGPKALLGKLFSDEVRIDVKNENQILLRAKRKRRNGRNIPAIFGIPNSRFKNR